MHIIISGTLENKHTTQNTRLFIENNYQIRRFFE
nr:MAG TPA: hypothetical protein [Caudoviricetes sp.]